MGRDSPAVIRADGDIHAGHSDFRWTRNRYGRLLPGGEAESANRLNAFFKPSKWSIAQALKARNRRRHGFVCVGLAQQGR